MGGLIVETQLIFQTHRDRQPLVLNHCMGLCRRSADCDPTSLGSIPADVGIP